MAENVAETRDDAPVLPRLTAVPGGVPDMDADITRLATQGSLRVRIAPTVYDADAGQHTSWKGVIYALELQDVAQAVEFRQDLESWMRGWVAARV